MSKNTPTPKSAKASIKRSKKTQDVDMNVDVEQGDSSSPDAPSSEKAAIVRLRGPRAVLEHGNFSLQPCSMPPQEEMQPVQKFVAAALLADQRSQQYQAVLDCIRKYDDPIMLRKICIALRTAGSTLHHMTKDPNLHAQIIHSLFKIDPFIPSPAVQANDDEKVIASIKDGTLADAFFHLLVALVSANSVFVAPVLNSLWKVVKRHPKDDDDEDSMLRHTKTHGCIATICRVCPKGTTELYPLVAGTFPFRMASVGKSLWYMEQALSVVGYAPSIRGKILAVLIDKCLEVDVEIKINNTGEVTIDDGKDNKKDDDNGDADPMFDMDGTPVKKDAGESKKEKVTDIKVDVLADKLDQMMEYLFEYINRIANSHPGAPEELFRIVSPVFDKVILTTHRSKYVQFVVMVICGLGESLAEANSALEASTSAVATAATATATANNNIPSTPSSITADVATVDGQPIPGLRLYRGFCHKLVGILIDSCRSMSTRQCAACYLASFISRSAFVCAETILECVTALLTFAESYILELKLKGYNFHANDARDQCDLHALFYTACQASFYIMCFRGKDVIELYREGEAEWKRAKEDPNVKEHALDALPPSFDLSQERWTKLCSHQLQPMRYCLESVRGEFLHFAQVFDLFDAQLMERLISEDRRMATSLLLATSQPVKKGRKTSRLVARKKRASAITTSVTLEKQRHKGGVGGLGRGSNPLDSFFPFDPYLLRRSYPLVEPFYRNWEGSVEKEVSEEEKKMDEEEEDENIKTGQPKEDDSDDSDSDSDSSDDDSDSSDDEEDDGDDHNPLENSVSRNLRNIRLNAPNAIRAGADIASPLSTSSSRDEQRRLWANMKRARAPSVDDGSW